MTSEFVRTSLKTKIELCVAGKRKSVSLDQAKMQFSLVYEHLASDEPNHQKDPGPGLPVCLTDMLVTYSPHLGFSLRHAYLKNESWRMFQYFFFELLKKLTTELFHLSLSHWVVAIPNVPKRILLSVAPLFSCDHQLAKAQFHSYPELWT